eukprot:4649735-Ditylum_brightwellii.AAC.1
MDRKIRKSQSFARYPRAPNQWEWEVSNNDGDNENGKTFEEELMEVDENQKATGKLIKLGKDSKGSKR